MYPWGTTFIVTAYVLLVTEALGLYVGVHFSGGVYTKKPPPRRPADRFFFCASGPFALR